MGLVSSPGLFTRALVILKFFVDWWGVIMLTYTLAHMLGEMVEKVSFFCLSDVPLSLSVCLCSMLTYC